MTDQECGSVKCGEFNMLKCISSLGHQGPHCYVVDHENDYPWRKHKPKRSTVKAARRGSR
jgi:hypothetical protein